MTLPASGAITYNNFNTEAGLTSGASISMSWIYSNTKAGQESYAINSYYSKAWYQKNNDAPFPGNCDTRSWFQTNCNCNCVCDCVCCFPADALVTMADGTIKKIEEVKIGEKVNGGYNVTNTVIAYHKIKMGNQPLFTINGKHKTTSEHRHWTTDGWAALDLNAAAPEYIHEITIDNFGSKERRKNVKLKDSKPVTLKRGMELITAQGKELIETIEIDWHQDPDQYVYTLICDGSHACVVNGIVVSAWARDDDFDYNTWTPKISCKVAA